MDVTAVRTFVTVVDAGQFQEAATDLSVTPQAVSKRIARDPGQLSLGQCHRRIPRLRHKVVLSVRLTRATLAVAAGALAPALLLSTPSLAGAATPAPAAVAAADAGSSYDEMDADDLRIAILRILADPDSGKRVTREANELLDDGTVEEMRAWLETGYRLAQAEDDSVAIARILADPDSGKAVVREANKALDDGSPEVVREFLETGLRLAQAEDDRVAIARILADPNISDALRAAANAALDDNTPEALRYFLEVGQYEIDS
ncbi:LysR family transcriptional regulator [Streptomyces phaeochromogenes]|uniref:ALF repeat-containing protein n=1 Tax=Streptomyces phaeochromogenes TaxID=1923 RepID=UPI0038649A7C|nr:LysR family transcriptional regulator [Streptomyces phaeochromogenes]